MRVCTATTDAVMCVGDEAAMEAQNASGGKGHAMLLSQPGLPPTDWLLSTSNDILKASVPTLTIT